MHSSTAVSFLAATACAALIASAAACGDRGPSPSSPTPVSVPWAESGSSDASAFDAHDPTLPQPTCEIDAARNQATWSSSGTSVSGFVARPAGEGPFPAVLVLHTRGGLSTHERSEASALANSGYVALAPDYFAPDGLKPQSVEEAHAIAYWTHVDRIRQHLDGGVECLKSMSFVDATRIGLVGFSLGGYFGLLLGARDDVTAVVSYYGAYHGEGASQVPTKHAFTEVAAQVRARVLMFHGDADSEVRIMLARNALRRLQEAGKQAELVVYPGVGHRFSQVGAPTYDAQATADAAARKQAFLP